MFLIITLVNNNLYWPAWTKLGSNVARETKRVAHPCPRRIVVITCRSRIVIRVFFIVLLSSVEIESGKVLIYAPFIAKSITITFAPLVKELARRGHQVWMIQYKSIQDLVEVNLFELEYYQW
jgi:hypothetical protein